MCCVRLGTMAFLLAIQIQNPAIRTTEIMACSMGWLNQASSGLSKYGA